MNQLRAAFIDLVIGFSRTQVWANFGWYDVLQRYRRSLLGPFWITLSAGAMIGGIGLLYSQLLRQPIAEYLPFLAVGLLTWFFLAAVLNEGCVAFISSGNMIMQVRLPFTVHALRVVFRNLVILAHNLVVLIPVYLWTGKAVNWGSIWAIPAILLLGVNGLFLALALGVLCARFRDVPPIIQNLVQLGFFLTPIMFHERSLGSMNWVARINPFFHFLEIVRAPLLGEGVPLDSWTYVAVATVLTCGGSFLFFARYRRRIPYWL